MKRIILSLFVVSLIPGCSTPPSSPEPHKTKYAFQCLQVTSPDSLVRELTFSFDTNAVAENYGQLKEDDLFGKQHVTTPASITLTHTQIEELIKKPNIEITEFPIVYAGLGESVTNDQTKSVSLPEDYEIVDGKAVVKEKICKLGYSTSVTIDKIKNGAISYHLNASHRELAGFDEYKTEDGISVKMPFFEGRSVDTDLTQQPNSWIVMGGLVDEKPDGKKINRIICVRIIPPNTDKKGISPPEDGYGPGIAEINLEYLGTEYYRADWRDIREIVITLLGMGYMEIKINDFEYHYYCPLCEGIEYQGADPLVVDQKNLNPINAWCKRNTGKFAEVGFDDRVDFSVVTKVVQILNSYGIRFSLSDADRSEQIKIDLLDGRPKTTEPFTANNAGF